MLSCEDCKNRAIAESQKLRQVDGESARDFYIRILNHFRIWDRFYFGLRRENLGVALDAYLNDLSIDEIINIISEFEKKTAPTHPYTKLPDFCHVIFRNGNTIGVFSLSYI